MVDYYIDILEPDDDLNIALDNLGREIGKLYQEAWEKNKRKLYSDKPFNLHINAFASLWFSRSMKVFIVYDQRTNDPIGFLTGVVFRPMPYEATVFQIQEYYTRDNEQIEKDLFAHVINALRIIGCDEVWVQSYVEKKTPDLGATWFFDGEHPIRRYVRKR